MSAGAVVMSGHAAGTATVIRLVSSTRYLKPAGSTNAPGASSSPVRRRVVDVVAARGRFGGGGEHRRDRRMASRRPATAAAHRASVPILFIVWPRLTLAALIAGD